jgi:hypothetical protein
VLTDLKSLLGEQGNVDVILDRANYLIYLSSLPDELQPAEGPNPANGEYGVCFTTFHWQLSYSAGRERKGGGGGGMGVGGGGGRKRGLGIEGEWLLTSLLQIFFSLQQQHRSTTHLFWIF